MKVFDDPKCKCGKLFSAHEKSVLEQHHYSQVHMLLGKTCSVCASIVKNMSDAEAKKKK